MRFLFAIASVLALAFQANPAAAAPRMVLFEEWTNVF
jgi:hypothetical protein